MFVKTNLGLAVPVGECVVYSFKLLMVNLIHWSICSARLMSTLQLVVFILVVSNDS